MGVATIGRGSRAERRLRSQEAVERQRATRHDRKVARERAKAGDEAAVSALELAVVGRLLARRIAKRLPVEPIQSSHLYWSLRRLGRDPNLRPGYDVLLPEFRSV